MDWRDMGNEVRIQNFVERTPQFGERDGDRTKILKWNSAK